MADLNGQIKKKLIIFFLNSISQNSSNGYILEIDLDYPDKLHELHNDYLLAPEKVEINHNMLSNYCSNIANKHDLKVGGVNKLVPNLNNKSKYVLHYNYFQLYLSLVIKLDNVHKILKLKQSDWLKNTLILIQPKEKKLQIVLKKTFSNWWIIVFMAKKNGQFKEENRCYIDQ